MTTIWPEPWKRFTVSRSCKAFTLNYPHESTPPPRLYGFCAYEKAPNSRPPSTVQPNKTTLMCLGGGVCGMLQGACYCTTTQAGLWIKCNVSWVSSEKRDVPVRKKENEELCCCFWTCLSCTRGCTVKSIRFCSWSIEDPNQASTRRKASRRFTELVESTDLRQTGKDVWQSGSLR